MRDPGPAETVVRAACPHDCPDTCAMLVTVREQDGRRVAVKIAGDPEHPTTAGVLCTKVSRYLERTYHPDRVLHPLRRIGRKGEGRFERVSWADALADIAGRLKGIAARDPQRIVPYSYAGTMGLVQGEAMASRFFHQLGASLLDRTICATAGGEALAATLGTRLGTDIEQFQDARLIVFWGTNAIASNLHLWSRAQEAKRRGAKLIAIDPYRSLTAEKCHQHIALMPGTDGAFALGVIHVLVREGWLDRDYIARYTLGFEALAERARGFDPDRVAALCGIRPDEVTSFARDYWEARPAAIRLNYGMQRTHGGGNAVRAVACLPALAGHWRDPAGGLLLSTSGAYRVDEAALYRPDLLAGRRPRTINMSTIGHDLLAADPPIDALIVYDSNPVAVAPQSSEVARGFAREDLFTVVLEHFQTDTADYADYVLPATTQLEHVDVHKSYGHYYMLANNPAIDPLGEALPNSEIFRRLAARMGFDDPCFSERRRRARRPGVRAHRHHGAFRLGGAEAARMAATRCAGLLCAVRAGPLSDAVRALRIRGRSTRGGRRGSGPGLCAAVREPDQPSGSGTAVPARDHLAARPQLPELHVRERQVVARHRGRADAGNPSGRCGAARHRGRHAGARLQRARQLRTAGPCHRSRPARVRGRAVDLVEEAGAGPSERERSHQPGADRHWPRADFLRLPGRGRTGRHLT